MYTYKVYTVRKDLNKIVRFDLKTLLIFHSNFSQSFRGGSLADNTNIQAKESLIAAFATQFYGYRGIGNGRSLCRAGRHI